MLSFPSPNRSHQRTYDLTRLRRRQSVDIRTADVSRRSRLKRLSERLDALDSEASLVVGSEDAS